VAGEPTAQAGLDAPEGKVDLVVHGHDVIQIDAQRPAGRADGRARLVHVSLGQQHGHSRPAGAGTTGGDEPAVLLLGLG
jgi:hypothetical protein